MNLKNGQNKAMQNEGVFASFCKSNRRRLMLDRVILDFSGGSNDKDWRIYGSESLQAMNVVINCSTGQTVVFVFMHVCLRQYWAATSV